MPMPHLRLNQGDPTESRVYFLPHFVAQQLGLFGGEGVDVEFIWSPPGEYLAKSGQIPAVLKGDAELTVGGPMVTMRMQAEGAARLVSVCGVVNRNPWYLAARGPEPNFKWSDLRDQTVIDVGNITTATLCFRWLLKQAGLSDSQVSLIPGSGDEERDLAAFCAGKGNYVLHSLHGLSPRLADGHLAPIMDLASPTGKVPWSTYIALPGTVSAREEEFAAFVRAMAGALRWVDTHTSVEIAALVGSDYPGYSPAGLLDAISRYKSVNLWSTDPLISREAFEHFRSILMDVGWFNVLVRYEDQVITSLATDARIALESR
jgi:NitT/TauT family transport system substrate-binding protein